MIKRASIKRTRGYSMKFSVNQSELNNALAVVIKGSSNRSTLSILGGVYIKASNNAITLQTTNLELSIKLMVSALVDEPGEVVVPAKLFMDIVKSLPDVAVTIESQDLQTYVFCNNATFSLKTLNPLDFPAFPEIDVDQKASFPFKAFSSMVKSTAKIVSRDESRAILTGVLINQTGSTLRMVSTDSYRLAVTETELERSIPSEFEAVISGAFLQDIASLPVSDNDIVLALNNNQIIITYQNITFINRRIEGTFPNYKQLLSDNYKTRVTLPTSDLTDAVRRVSLLSNKVSPVQINVDSEANIVTLTTTSQDIGNAQEVVMGEVEGEPVDIAFNYLFVLDGLNAIKSNTLYLDLFGAMKPGILRATDDQNFLYLIMPVRV